MRERLESGTPAPLGASCRDGGVNFALYSGHAERVELCLFEADGTPGPRFDLPACSDGVWHGFLAGHGAGQRYGYRVHGPHAPHAGHRFNAHKLLIDPYARLLDGPLIWSDASYGFIQGDPQEDLSFDTRDSAPGTPKCVVVDDAFEWGGTAPPAVAWNDTVLYETHVRGFTVNHPGVPEEIRGTFSGLGHPGCIDYLRALGITSVELLPVQAFVDEHFLTQRNLRNYWGYNPFAFFAPASRYLGPDGLASFKGMVRALHEAGIEVVLDVVYNHSAEGNRIGPTLSLRGIDNASYYRLQPDNPREYTDYSGCGNTLNLDHPRALALVVDSLRYWAEEMQVDGFRFDLACALARHGDTFSIDSPFLQAVAADPILSRRKLIAEPWDLGPHGYRLGGFPPDWAEWNDRFRDTTRCFWRGDAGVLPEFARRLHGSDDLFGHPERGPWASVNFVTSHDGFTLNDLVSYKQRHNSANGEDNRDGHHMNYSDNYGTEGPSDDPPVIAMRERQQRNLLATVFLSQGTPMLLAGDEIARTQRGNNNAYCQDNETGWLDWSGIETAHELLDFTRRLVALRARHPVLRRTRFAHGNVHAPVNGFADIQWLREDGAPMRDAEWADPERRTVGLLLAEPASADGASDHEDTLLVIVNAGDRALVYTLPDGRAFAGWRCTLATAPYTDEVLSMLEVDAHAVYVLVPHR